ncbi:acyltransferase [Burkholderiales bacterium]|jgi:acetyltransferase-like isoleucine patch superfamily enzyme|nr:acyltransferase [Burkholderiales bacterium]
MANNFDRQYGYKVELQKGMPIYKNLRLYINKVLQFVARKFLLTPNIRVVLHKLRGVKLQDSKNIFIGEDVFIDEVFPDLVTIGSNVMITEGVMIFTHLYDPTFSEHAMQIKPVKIEDNVFIGARSIILNGATLGRGCVIGAASLVTRDVPPYAIVAGSPARQVGSRGGADPSELPSSSNIRSML